jgi:hypothetical protein
MIVTSLILSGLFLFGFGLPDTLGFLYNRFSPETKWSRWGVAFCWLGIAGIAFWMKTKDVEMSNMFTGAAMLGALVRACATLICKRPAAVSIVA